MEQLRPRIIFVTGAPGTGKGTQCARLSEELNFRHISVGDLMRAEVAAGSEEGHRITEIVRSGQLVPKELTVALLLKELNATEASTVLVDGFPRAVDQAVYLERAGVHIDFILHFEASNETVLLNRLIERGKTSGRADDKEETIIQRFIVYKAESAPILEFYRPFGVVRVVDSLGTLPEVFFRTLCTLRPELLFVCGPSFSGKTVVAQWAREQLYFHYIPLSAVNTVTVNGQKRRLTDNEAIVRKAVEALQDAKHQQRVVLDGFPMNRDQARLFEHMLGSPSKVLYLSTARDTCQERVLGTVPSLEFNQMYSRSLNSDLLGFYAGKMGGNLYEIKGNSTMGIVYEQVRKALEPEVVLVRGSVKAKFLLFLEKEGYKLLNGAHLLRLWSLTRTTQPVSLSGEYSDCPEIIGVLKDSIYSGNGTSKFALYNFALKTVQLVEEFERSIARISTVYYLYPAQSDSVSFHFYFKGLLVPLAVSSWSSQPGLSPTEEQDIHKQLRTAGPQRESWVIPVLGPCFSGKSTFCARLKLKCLDFQQILEETKSRLSTGEEPLEELTFAQCIEGTKQELKKDPSATYLLDGLPPQEILFAKDPLFESTEPAEEGAPLEEDPFAQLRTAATEARLKAFLSELPVLSVVVCQTPMEAMQGRARSKHEVPEEEELPLELRNELLESWSLYDRLQFKQQLNGLNIPKTLLLQTHGAQPEHCVANVFKRKCLLLHSEYPVGYSLFKDFAWKHRLFYIDFPSLVANQHSELSLAQKLQLLSCKLATAPKDSQFVVLSGYFIFEEEYSTSLEELVKIEETIGELHTFAIFTGEEKHLEINEIPVSRRENKEEEDENEPKQERAPAVERPMWAPTTVYQFFHRLRGRKSQPQTIEVSPENLENVGAAIEAALESPERATLQFLLSPSQATACMEFLESQEAKVCLEYNEDVQVEIAPLLYESQLSVCLTNPKARTFYQRHFSLPYTTFTAFYDRFKEVLKEEGIPLTRGVRKVVKKTVDRNRNFIVETEEINSLFNLLESPGGKETLLDEAKGHDQGNGKDKVKHTVLLAFEHTSPATTTNVLSFERGRIVEITPEGVPGSPRFCADGLSLFGRSNKFIENDIVFHSSDNRIKEQHFQIQARSDSFYIVDNSGSLDIIVGDLPVLLFQGCVVTVGSHRFHVVSCVSPQRGKDVCYELEFKGLSSQCQGPAKLQILFVSDHMEGASYEFTQEQNVINIGSGAGNDIVLEGLNRSHLKIQLGNSWTITDLHTASGTLISVNTYQGITQKRASFPLKIAHNCRFSIPGHSFRLLHKSTVPIKQSRFPQIRSEDFYEFYDIGKSISDIASELYFCTHKVTGRRGSVKILSLASIRDTIGEELGLLKRLDHPNLIKVFDVLEHKEELYIVTELYTGDDLLSRIVAAGTLKENQAAATIRELLQAVSYIHGLGLVHNDIQPANLVFETEAEDSALKLTEFTSARLNSPKMTEFLGSALYIAPEVLKQNYNEKRDIWAVGVILHTMLVGAPPFSGNSTKEILSRVRKGGARFKEKAWSRVTPYSRRIVKLMLSAASVRPSASELLQDPWLKGTLDFVNTSSTISVRAMKSLKTFHATNALQSAVLRFISNSTGFEALKKQAAGLFAQLDTNNEGSLSPEEIRVGLVSLSLLFEASETESVLGTLDANGDGKVDYSEFIAAVIGSKIASSKEELERNFEIFDVDGNGEITTTELKDILGESSEDWGHLLKDIDENKDGKIEFKEFKNMMFLKIN